MAATIQNVRDVECVVFSTTGIFGDRLAGDVYNLKGRAVDRHHYRLLSHIFDEYGPIAHSVCYIDDDGIGVAPHLLLIPTPMVVVASQSRRTLTHIGRS